MGNHHGFSQNILSVELAETRAFNSQYLGDEEERLLRDKGRIREKWMRFFRSLLNAKFERWIPSSRRGSRRNLSRVYGIESTEEDIDTAAEEIANAKAVGPDGHLV